MTARTLESVPAQRKHNMLQKQRPRPAVDVFVLNTVPVACLLSSNLFYELKCIAFQYILTPLKNPLPTLCHNWIQSKPTSSIKIRSIHKMWLSVCSIIGQTSFDSSNLKPSVPVAAAQICTMFTKTFGPFFLQSCLSSDIFLGCLMWATLFKSFHNSSIGLRSQLWLLQSSRWIFSVWSYSPHFIGCPIDR